MKRLSILCELLLYKTILGMLIGYRRAWHQAHTPLSTIRLVPYLPPTAHVHMLLDSEPEPKSGAYYLNRFGGVSGLARLYLEAGLLYLEGIADNYLPHSHAAVDDNESSLTTKADAEKEKENEKEVELKESEKWKSEKHIARKLFDRARMLDHHLDIPNLPDSDAEDLTKSELRMPDVTLETTANAAEVEAKLRRRRRGRPGESMVEQANGGGSGEDSDSTWYVWLPGLIGAGTALLAVGLIGAMSIGNWRKSQNS